MALLWIPGIIGLTWKPEATVWTVPLVWWSGWLSVVWGGWWGAALSEFSAVRLARAYNPDRADLSLSSVAKLGPKVLHYTVGTIAPELRHYITYVKAIEFYTGELLVELIEDVRARLLTFPRIAGAAGWALGAFNLIDDPFLPFLSLVFAS